MDEATTASATQVRLTPAGGAALAAALTTTLAGLVLLSGPVFSVGLTGLAILRLCRHLAFRHLSGIGIIRSLPHRAQAGESFPVETMITRGQRFPAGITIRFTDPLAAMRQDRAIAPANDRTSLLRYTGKSPRRGFYRARHWTMRSTWPLGLFEGTRSGAFQDSNPVIVQPKPFLPNRLKSHLNRLSLESAENSPAPPEPAADFRLLREFRSGDPIRSINWPSSLRSGQLHVSELEPPRPKPRAYGILVHSHEPAGQVLTPETFEMILRITTGLLFRFQREEIPLVFRHYPDKATTLSNRSAFEAALDRLALCRRMPSTSIESLCAAAGDFRNCDEVFILSDCPGVEWGEALREHFTRSTCIDATSLTSQSRPGLKTRLRLLS